MSRFIYGGIELAPVQVTVQRRPVWDGNLFLYSEVTVTARGWYNPSTTSWDLPGKALGTIDPSMGLNGQTAGIYNLLSKPNYPISGQQLGRPAFRANLPAGSGAMPATTDTAIRELLVRPRQLLVWENGGVAVVVSPLPVPGGIGPFPDTFHKTDFKNGPVPLACNLRQVNGSKSWLVEFTVQTYLSDADLFQSSSSISALLAHLWVMSERLDTDGYCTRVIKGRARFRTDRLFAQNLTPDSFRGWLFHGCPDGFRRETPQVEASDDGAELRYVLVDRQTPLTTLPPKVRIQAFMTSGFATAGLQQSIFDLGMWAGGTWLQSIPAAFAGGMGIIDLTRPLGITMKAVPRLRRDVVVRVWGAPDTTRNYLYTVAMVTMLAKAPTIIDFQGETSIQVTEDLAGKFVEVRGSVLAGPGTAFKQAFNGTVFPDLAPDVSDDIKLIFSSQPGQNPGPLNDKIPGTNQGSRGTYVAGVAARALQFTTPPDVPGTQKLTQPTPPAVVTGQAP